MSPLLIKICKDFATIWTTIDPIGNVAIFAGVTASLTRSERHRTALRATLYAAVILVVAVVAGQIIETRSLPTLTRSYPSSLYLLCR
jgi:multiple antibiotic resistance protein